VPWASNSRLIGYEEWLLESHQLVSKHGANHANVHTRLRSSVVLRRIEKNLEEMDRRMTATDKDKGSANLANDDNDGRCVEYDKGMTTFARSGNTLVGTMINPPVGEQPRTANMSVMQCDRPAFSSSLVVGSLVTMWSTSCTTRSQLAAQRATHREGNGNMYLFTT
jgi:hypothetical protein